MRIYLASQSPRRRELLTQIGVAFDTIIFRSGARADPETDETPQPGEAALDYVERVARAKAAHGARILGWRRLVPQPILSADTTLEVDGDIIGKPFNEADATAILKRLSGREHRVLTAVAVTHEERIECRVSVSHVRFRPLADDEIRRYVMTGEPMDKAGAYGIQGRAAMFIEHAAGSYSGIMGLPLCETTLLLREFGLKV